MITRRPSSDGTRFFWKSPASEISHAPKAIAVIDGSPLMIVREPEGPTCMTSPSDVEANTPRSSEAGHMAMIPAGQSFNGDVPVRCRHRC